MEFPLPSSPTIAFISGLRFSIGGDRDAPLRTSIYVEIVRRAVTDPPERTDEWDPDDILDAVNHENARQILAYARLEPMSAEELAEQCDSSMPTIYRQINSWWNTNYSMSSCRSLPTATTTERSKPTSSVSLCSSTRGPSASKSNITAISWIRSASSGET